MEVVRGVSLLEIFGKQRQEDCCNSWFVCGVTEVKRAQK
jgi:hypothetical protein